MDNDFEVIIRNTDLNDPDELRDVLTMLCKQVDASQKKIRQLEARLKKSNIAKNAIGKNWRIPLKSEEM